MLGELPHKASRKWGIKKVKKAFSQRKEGNGTRSLSPAQLQFINNHMKCLPSH